MAARDVKEYYFKLIAQKAELEADLADFEEALKFVNYIAKISDYNIELLQLNEEEE